MEINLICAQTEDIPHGHGLSFKKGVADALLGSNALNENIPNGHENSYERGKILGEELKLKIAELVRD